MATSSTATDLVCFPGVELCQAGTWDASTGRHTITMQDLADAVAATKDPAFRTPVVYLGHTHESFGDAGPNVGTIENLRLNDSGTRLIGDLHVLAGVAALAPVAWPSRSIEANIEALAGETSSTGHHYGLVLTGLALLGSWAPAIETLADLPALAVAAAAPGERLTLTRLEEPMTNTNTKTVAASVNVEDIRRCWWDCRSTMGTQFAYSWVADIYAGADAFIFVELWEEDVPEGAPTLYRIPWAEAEAGSDCPVVFGTPEAWAEVYMPLADAETAVVGDAVMASAERVARFGRPEKRVAASVHATETSERSEGMEPTTEITEDTETIEAAAATATETDVEVPAVDTETEEVATIEAAAETTTTVIPDGFEVISSEILAELREAHAALLAKREEDRIAKREALITEAIHAGKMKPHQADSFSEFYDKAPAAAESFVANLSAGVPVGATGHASSPVADQDIEAARSAFHALPGGKRR